VSCSVLYSSRGNRVVWKCGRTGIVADGSMVEGIGVGHLRAMGLNADHFMDHFLGTRALRH
jgi:hypothetical protein